MTLRSLTSVILGLLFTIGCAKTPLPTPNYGPSWREAKSALRQDIVLVAPIQLVQDLEPPELAPIPPPDAVEEVLQDNREDLAKPTELDTQNEVHAHFLRNEFLGNVRFGGGLIRTGHIGIETRARLIEFGQQEAYTKQVSEWLNTELQDRFTKAKIHVIQLDDVDIPGPTRKKFRGAHELDDKDNINVPRTTLEPKPLTEAQRHALQSQSRWLFVPVIRNYFSHNAGWFLGQKWGTMSGARHELMLVLYDLNTGSPAWWMTTEARYIERTGTPSSADLDRYLLEVEGMTKEFLDKRLFR